MLHTRSPRSSRVRGKRILKFETSLVYVARPCLKKGVDEGKRGGVKGGRGRKERKGYYNFCSVAAIKHSVLKQLGG